MPVYLWSGVNALGEKAKGEIEAKDEKGARLLLERQRVKIKRLKPKPKDIFENISFFQPKIKTKDIVIFTRQLSTMIDAGLPLIQALDVLSGQMENPTFKKMLASIKSDVESGSTFASALQKYPKYFDRLFTNMVAAGEIGGILDDVLRRQAAYMEKAQALKSKVKGAMTYPAIVLCIAFGVLAIILIFVIPTFAKMFAEFGHELPLPTQMVINLSNFMQSYFLVIMGGLAGLWFLLKKYYSTASGRLLIDRIFLKLPVFGMLIRKVAVAKFTRTLGTLINSGVPIIEALNVAGATSGNKVIENAIMNVKTGISEGRPIAEPLGESMVFPGMVVQMIAVGEATGALDAMLDKIADFYDEEVDTAVEALTSMIEPFMIVFLGGTVGSIIIAMYLPIFEMAGAVGG